MDDLRQGQQHCFAAIFGEYYSALCLYAFRITKDQTAAEDIVEESFIKIWERREDFFHINVLRSFLYTTVRNASINWRKQHQRQQNLLQNEYAFLLGNADSKLENMIIAELFRDLYTAIEKLPAQSRQVISMHYFDGKKTSEIAKELDISPAHASTQKKRGLVLLRKLLPTQSFLFSLALLLNLFF